MLELPEAGLEIVIVATASKTGALPSLTLPFLNVTDPVGVGPDELTVAVRAIDWPYVDGFRLDVETVLVEYRWITCFRSVELAGL